MFGLVFDDFSSGHDVIVPDDVLTLLQTIPYRTMYMFMGLFWIILAQIVFKKGPA
jgi:hypothetical protein